MGILTEMDFTRLVGVPPSDLGLQKKFVVLKSHEEGTSLKVWFCSLAGLDYGEVASMRKMKIYHRVEVVQDTVLLDRTANLTDQQGKTWFDFARKQELEKHRPSGAKISNRMQHPTLAQLKEEAEEVLHARRDKVKADFQAGQQNASVHGFHVVVVIVAIK